MMMIESILKAKNHDGKNFIRSYPPMRQIQMEKETVNPRVMIFTLILRSSEQLTLIKDYRNVYSLQFLLAMLP